LSQALFHIEASVIVVLDTLAIFCQGKGFAAPAPSFLGSPGFPLWLSVMVSLNNTCIVLIRYTCSHYEDNQTFKSGAPGTLFALRYWTASADEIVLCA